MRPKPLLAFSVLLVGSALPALAQTAALDPGATQARTDRIEVAVDAPAPRPAPQPALQPAEPVLLLASASPAESSSLYRVFASPSAAAPFFAMSQAEAPVAAAPAAGGKKIPWYFWATTAAMFGSTFANAETLNNCTNCTYLPESMRRRGTAYGAGLTIDLGVALLTRRFAKSRFWWIAPEAAVTAANGFLAYHWASKTD